MGSRRKPKKKLRARQQNRRPRKKRRPGKRSRPVRPEPSELDQVLVLIVEEQLGLKKTDLKGLEELAAALPFEPSMSILSALVHHVEAALRDASKQIEVAEKFFGSIPLVERYRQLLARQPDAIIFGPQSLYTLMRILVDAAYDAPISQSLTGAESATLIRALVASNSAIEWGVERELGPTINDLLAYELQVGNYYSRPPWLEEMVRHRELYRLATEDPGLLASPDCVPIEQWLERTGLTVEEQWRLGFALSAVGPSWEPTKPPHIAAEALRPLLRQAGLADRETEALDTISATRQELQIEFADLNASGRRHAWECRPFATTPFLRVADGGLVPLGRPWILSWLSEGFYYRAMRVAQAEDSARADGQTNHVQNFTAYSGQVFERYCLGLAERAVPAPATVMGEQEYGNRKERKLTSDVAILASDDLILFEANARRVGAEPLVSGDPLEAATELTKLLVKKIDQLGGCVGALLSGEATLPGVDLARVKRIWPVVLAQGHVWQTSNLWRYLDTARNPERCRSLKERPVQPLQVMDARDYEKLLALAHLGHDLPRMLRRKASGPYRTRDLAVWLHDDPQAPGDSPRLPDLEAVWHEMTEDVRQAFRPDPT